MNRELDVRTIKREREQIAIRHGLPPIGARMVNQHGIEWLVDGHLYAPTVTAAARPEGFAAKDARDLIPVLIPQNFSDRLTEFYFQVDRCTSKTLYLLDTMPYLRPHAAHPDGHSVDSMSNPDLILFFLDAAHIHETVLAHEIGHLWIDLVEDCEDWRMLRDTSDASRVIHLQHIQSFVLDQKVNQVIAGRGFDMSVMDHQYLEAMMTLGRALENGYTPKTRMEAAFDALYIACACLHWQTHAASPTIRGFGQALASIESNMPQEVKLSREFIGSVEKHGFDDRAAVRAAIDECLQATHAFGEEEFDVDKDLIDFVPEQSYNDKYPTLFPGLPVPAKLEIGKAMAKQGIGLEPICYRTTPALGGCNAQIKTDTSTTYITELSPTIPLTRNYMPGIGLWLSRARLEEQLKGEHPYGYANNNPVKYVDPSGMLPDPGIPIIPCPASIGKAKDALCAALKRIGDPGILHSKCCTGPKQAQCLLDWCNNNQGNIYCVSDKSSQCSGACAFTLSTNGEQNPDINSYICLPSGLGAPCNYGAHKCKSLAVVTILHERMHACGTQQGGGSPDPDPAENRAQCLCPLLGL